MYILILKVSTGKQRIRKGSRLFSSTWTPTGLADPAELTQNIIEFCQGFSVHKIGMMEQDGITVGKGSKSNYSYHESILTGVSKF